MKRYIIVRTNFPGFHFWKDAPVEVDFLKKTHRHIFHVEVKIPVSHDDRQLEFFIVKKFLNEVIVSLFPENHFEPMTFSCEIMAEKILEVISDKYGIKKDLSVSVFEDNENGGFVCI